MIPMITELGLAALITAAGSSIAALIGSLVQGMKTRAEVEQMRGHVTAAMETAQHELTHNHGSSMKDASTRTEEKVDVLTELVRGVDARMDRIESRQDSLERSQRGMARDVGRLADADQQTGETVERIQSEAHAEHGRLWAAISRAAGHRK